jgi:exodeoxyribonuclease VII large subunit
MPKQTTSQWDFGGELFPVEAARRVFSVSELTADIRRLLEQHVGQVWVTGEITNCRAQSSGHIYFTLKDAAAQLNCIVFRTDAPANRAALQDGRKVILKGEMTVYEPRGQYQLRVLAIELQGVGALQAAFEKLKEKLAAEGLFAPERKQPLPRFPQRIGLVTSPGGAALRDVLHVARRRNPSLEIIFVPCAVQGPGAAAEIAAAIARLNQWSKIPGRKLDVILLTRGGGSLEDLWAFNEEIVARAIFNSALPVVSAVGHEIDFTISDFAADVRAATPSAAAEILTEAVFSSGKWMARARVQMRDLVRRRLLGERRHFQQLWQRFRASHPRRLLHQRLQRLDDLQLTLSRCARQQLQKCRLAGQNLGVRLDRVRPGQLLAQRRAALAREQRRLRERTRHSLRGLRQRGDALQTRLRLLGPEQVLARGYSITLDAASAKIIRSKEQTRPGQTLKTRLQSGEVRSVVQEGK